MSQSVPVEEWGVALVNGDGKTSLVEGPFPTRTAAAQACIRLNEHLANRPWQWARWGEIPRTVTCTVRKP